MCVTFLWTPDTKRLTFGLSGTGVFLTFCEISKNTSSDCFCKEESGTAHELRLQNSKWEEGTQVLTTSFLGKTTS